MSTKIKKKDIIIKISDVQDEQDALRESYNVLKNELDFTRTQYRSAVTSLCSLKNSFNQHRRTTNEEIAKLNKMIESLMKNVKPVSTKVNGVEYIKIGQLKYRIENNVVFSMLKSTRLEPDNCNVLNIEGGLYVTERLSPSRTPKGIKGKFPIETIADVRRFEYEDNTFGFYVKLSNPLKSVLILPEYT